MLKNLIVALVVMFLLFFLALVALGPAGVGPTESVLFLALTIVVVVVVVWRSHKA